MKISKKYIIINSVIILLTSLFLIFLLVFKHNDHRLPNWILAVGYLFFVSSVLSFIWHLKSVRITEKGIQINRVLFPNVIIDKDNIIEIEESRFKYSGESSSKTVYKGYYLTISSKDKKYKTSSLNEPNYYELRKILKKTYGKLVKLDKEYKGDSVNWFYIFIMLLPAGYLFVEIIKIIK